MYNYYCCYYFLDLNIWTTRIRTMTSQEQSHTKHRLKIVKDICRYEVNVTDKGVNDIIMIPILVEYCLY